MTNRRQCATGSALVLAGLSCAIIGGLLYVHRAGPCHDIAAGNLIFARTSAGIGLPIPVVQMCDHALPLFVMYYAGYLLTGAGAVITLRANLSALQVAAVTLSAVTLAAAVPFVPTTDSYAYALYSYETAVMHVTPYAPHDLPAHDAIARPLNSLFPGNRNPLRVVAYGPVFSALYAAFVGPFGFVSLRAMILVERLFGAAMLIVLGLLTSLLVLPAAERSRIFLSVVLNPLMLFESVSFSHGDVAMLCCLAGAFIAFRRGRFAVCAALCVVASEIRIIAVLALVAMLAELLQRRNRRMLLAAGASSAVTLALSYTMSQVLFHGFGSTGAVFHSNYDAAGPIIALLAMGDTAAASATGLTLQWCFAFTLGYAALRERKYEFLPVSLLAALPVLETWYVQWLVPVAALARPRYRGAVAALIGVIPLKTLADMLAMPQAAALRAAVVVFIWLVPIATYIALGFVERNALAGTYDA